MKKGFSPLLLTIILLFGLQPLPSQANSYPASGSFTATQPCPAYQSKRNQTNPDNTTLAVGESYNIIESNSANRSDWYRITINSAKPRDRWVEAKCGTISAAVAAPPRASSARDNSCNQPGLADSYVLALSWQTAFCEGHRDKPECKLEQKATFTLHGLWPNKQSCGTQYGFCGEVKTKKKSFCDLKPVPMSDKTHQQLATVMPSAAAGSCLERHEWYKHGTCQTDWDADGYYLRSITLTEEFNRGAINRFMSNNEGKKVKAAQFFAAVDQALGPNAHKRLQLSCDKGNLVDLYINLPKTLPANTPLAELVQQAPENFRNRCGSSFTVDAAGY